MYHLEPVRQGQTVYKEVKEDVGTGVSKWVKTGSEENGRRFLPGRERIKAGKIGPIGTWKSRFQNSMVLYSLFPVLPPDLKDLLTGISPKEDISP